MAYLYVNSDGVTRPFSTINDAMAAAAGGDTIVIDPGVYPEQVHLTTLTSGVNIRGNTLTPENDDIIISYNDNPLFVGTTLTAAAEIYIEGVTLRNTYPSNWGSVFYAADQDSNQYLSLIFNRCRFLLYGNNFSFAAWKAQSANGYFNKLWFDHCEWDMTTVNLKHEYRNLNWTRVADSKVLACVYEGGYNNDLGSGSPSIHNYVTAPAEGYGLAYSNDWYTPLATGYFTGYVTEGGTPVQRTINLYDRATGAFIDTTTSDPSTGYYYMGTTSSGLHYLVCLDGPADPLQNDLIIGSAYPTAL